MMVVFDYCEDANKENKENIEKLKDDFISMKEIFIIFKKNQGKKLPK